MRPWPRVFLFFVVALQMPAIAQGESLAQRSRRFEHNVVLVSVTKQEYDLESPWTKEQKSTAQHLGIVVGRDLILTTAYAVADASYIEMRRFGESAKFGLKQEFVDYEVNLALLKPLQPNALHGVEETAIDATVEIGSEIDILKERDIFQLRRLPARLVEIDIRQAVTSGYSLATFLIDAKQRSLGWSEPIVCGGRFVGLTAGQDDQYVYGIPGTIIRHFLQDYRTGKYRGFPGIGIVVKPLIAPALRDLLGAAKYRGGVRVVRVFADSPVLNVVKPDDVLLEVNGKALNENGYYNDPDFGQIHFKYLVNKLYGGDELRLLILRQGREITVPSRLTRFDSNRTLIPRYRYGQPEPYMIFGGLLFQELSRPFLESWGDGWRQKVPLVLLNIFDYDDVPKSDPAERVVVMNRVLADDFNKGYENLQNLVLVSVNGERATSLKRLKDILQEKPIRKNGKRYAVFEFSHGQGEVILTYEGLDLANHRIAKNFGINGKAEFFEVQ